MAWWSSSVSEFGQLETLQSHRTVASPWQQDAIDRTTGLANDLATNMNTAIDRLNKSKSRPTAPPYPEYLKANTQIASDLASEIDATIDFAQNKAKLDSSCASRRCCGTIGRNPMRSTAHGSRPCSGPARDTVPTMFPVWHDKRMPKEPKRLAFCCLAILLTLYVVGVSNHGVLRQIVQTLPLWVPIVLGFRGSEFVKWSALPCLITWLASMIFIWLFGVAWVYVALGRFSLIDIAMTVIVGVASAGGFFAAVRWHTAVRLFPAGATAVLLGALQFLALWVSMLLPIAHR
jgi:hypothetical protein